jgi:hypothetical protein
MSNKLLSWDFQQTTRLYIPGDIIKYLVWHAVCFLDSATVKRTHGSSRLDGRSFQLFRLSHSRKRNLLFSRISKTWSYMRNCICVTRPSQYRLSPRGPDIIDSDWANCDIAQFRPLPVASCIKLQNFRRNILPLFSPLKSKPWVQTASRTSLIIRPWRWRQCVLPKHR